MKLKKTAIILLSFVLVVSCAIAFTACNKTSERTVRYRRQIHDSNRYCGRNCYPPQSNAPIGFKEVWYKDKTIPKMELRRRGKRRFDSLRTKRSYRNYNRSSVGIMRR